MRVTGKVGARGLHILVDSGSTHNFLDISTAKKLICELQKIPPLVVVVADGAQIQCQWKCKGFVWTLEEMNYQTDAYIVPRGSCDMILGIQWLSTLGFILWNFANLTMEFSYKGRRRVLQGQRRKELQWAKGSTSKLLSSVAQLFAIHISPVTIANTSIHDAGKEPRLSQLMKDYAIIFEEPSSLPLTGVMITKLSLRKEHPQLM